MAELRAEADAVHQEVDEFLVDAVFEELGGEAQVDARLLLRLLGGVGLQQLHLAAARAEVPQLAAGTRLYGVGAVGFGARPL